MRKPNTLCVTAERFSICVSYLYVYSVKLILTLIHTYNLYSQILAEGLPTKEHFFYLNMTKTVHAQYMNFNRLARLWNKLPQHIRMSDSLSSFKGQLGVLYKTYLIDFDINNRCTLGIICCCSGFDVR